MRGPPVSLIIPAHPRHQGEGGYTGFFVRPIRHALSTETRLSALFSFNHLRTLLFSAAHLSPMPPMLFALFPQKLGGTPVWSYQSNHSPSPPRLAWAFPLLPLPHLLPLPPLHPVPPVPIPAARASTITSNLSHTPTEVTPK